METRVIVCGGRHFCNADLFNSSLTEILAQYQNVRIVSGHASGADSMAEQYASKNGIPCSIFPADWKKWGRAAGPIRNKEMLDFAFQETAVVVAFWNGTSKGTKDMIQRAERAGAKVHTVMYTE